MIKRLINFIYNLLLGGLSAFTMARYFIFEMGKIDVVTKVCLMLITIAGVGKLYLGWRFPLIPSLVRKYFPKTKPEKYLKMIENEDFTVIFFIIKLLERIGKTMKKILNWLWINKVTISGLLGFVLYSLDNYFQWTKEFGMTEGWYYGVITIIFMIIAWAIKGRGFEKTDLISDIIKLYQDYKQEKKVVKAATKRAKQRLKNAPLIDAIKEEVKKELQPKPPQPPTPHQNQNRVGRL